MVRAGQATDGTARRLRALQHALLARGVECAISTGRQLVRPVFVAGDASSGNRIDFLARLRNAALWPMLQLADATPARRFDKVVVTL